MSPATKPLVLLLLVSAIFVSLSPAQHWSFDLRPGGKREAADAVVFQNPSRETEPALQARRTEMFPPDCPSRVLAKLTPRMKKP
ncbi:progonadoliberin-1-like [Chiloscyllium plagiosum]|uniref:progonadoliberin-1-like n=1 Tax=Chiloscyllium plagiosum TaxID=36176 RepID=UPI001CB81E90|nr:progonadoliberin-1-like [Chiloscyllium plagiosum]XP_043537646.1 progonadoliberin-1-like [Chiloscyllium plagiosum]